MKIYVQAIEGTAVYIPMPARHLDDDRYLLLDSDEFDPNDTYRLCEFLPGDTVRVVCRAIPGDPQPTPVAETLISTTAKDRAYWDLLFRLVSGGPQVQLEMNDLRRQAAERISQELDDSERYHYPATRHWIETQTGRARGSERDGTDT